MPKILVIDDDIELGQRLKDWFQLKGDIVEVANTAEDGLQLLDAFSYDVVLLDWSLPGMSGLEACRELRKKGNSTYIIFLTAQNDICEKEAGFDAGADDYITKPFDVREISARIRSVLRRPSGILPSEVRIGDVLLHPEQRMLQVGQQEVRLMPKESALLEYLMRHPNRSFSSQQLLDAVWPSDSESSVETVRTWMKKLRRKLADAGKVDLIKTLVNAGYTIEHSE